MGFFQGAAGGESAGGGGGFDFSSLLQGLLGGQQQGLGQQQGPGQQMTMQNLGPLLQILGQGGQAGGRGNPLIANALQQQGGTQNPTFGQRPPIQVPPQMTQPAVLPQGFNNIGQLLGQRGGAPQVPAPTIPINPIRSEGGNQTIQPFFGGGIGQIF